MRLSHFLLLLLVTGMGLLGVSPRPCCHLCGGSGHGVLPLWACPQFLWEMSVAVEFLSQRGFTCSQMLANAVLRGGPVCPLSASVGVTHVQLFPTPWTIAHQAPLSRGFSRQEHWSGLPFPPPGGLPTHTLNLHLPSLLRCRWILYR